MYTIHHSSMIHPLSLRENEYRAKSAMEEKERVEDNGIKVRDNALIGEIAGGRGRILSARSMSAGDRIMRRKRERGHM